MAATPEGGRKMEQAKVQQPVVPGDDQGNMHLELHVEDSTVIEFLSEFEEARREEKALEALKVGVIAIRSASPSLDTKIVEEKFRDVEGRISKCLDGFQDGVKDRLEEHFKPGTGYVDRSLESLFGDKGTLTLLLNEYFGPNGGKVSGLIQNHIGPSSEFAKSLDPSNKESVISRIEETVRKNLDENAENIVKEFSLDTEESALTRLKSELFKEIKRIEDNNNELFGQIRETLGIKAGKEAEAKKGTEKGRVFEMCLYDRVAEIGHQTGDSTDNVRAVVGKIPYSKKGDYVIQLGDTSAAPGYKIVVEAKKEQGYRLKDAIEELKEAKENREAALGIFAFAKGYSPPEVGDFLRVGEDFFVTVDEECFENHQPLLFLEAAYKMGRALIVTSVRKGAAQELDLDRVRSEVDSLSERVKRFSELTTKAKTIKNNADFIESTLNEMKSEMESHLSTILGLLSSKQTAGA